MGTLVSGGKARTNLEIERAAQSALLGGRDIVGDTHAMAYIGLQLLTK